MAEAVDLKERITNIIKDILKDGEYGFEVYAAMKSAPALKRLVLYEGTPEERNNQDVNFKRKIQNAIEMVIRENYLAENAEYDLSDNIADNQKKFYVITQDEEYNPFAEIKTASGEIEHYRSDEWEDVKGFFFCFKQNGKSMWAYQQFYSNMVSNRKGNRIHFIPKDDVFVEWKKPLLFISKKVDVLVIGEEIITSDIGFMQRYMGFDEFTRISAKKVITEVESLEVVESVDKLTDYIERSSSSYARKMMRIKNSRVLQKPAEELLLGVHTLPRWKGKFEFDGNNEKIVLKTYKQVENLIDLLDERYTRSDVTGEEYDTSAKKWIEPVS